MVLRDLIDQVGGNVVGMIMLVARPALTIGIFFLIYNSSKHLPQGMSLLAFLVTGWLGYFAFIRTFRSFKGDGGTLRLFPQVTPLDVVLTNTIVEWLIYTIVFSGFVLSAPLFEHSPLPANPLQLYFAFWTIDIFGSLLAVIVSSAARVVPLVDSFSIIYRRIAGFVSGAAVTAADMPNALLDILKWSPLFQCIELMREAWWPAYVSPIADVGYVVKCLFFMSALGLGLERYTRRYMT